jgi:hypothetical protein
MAFASLRRLNLLAETDARAVVRLASWQDEQRSKLEIHEPELVGTVALVEKGP